MVPTDGLDGGETDHNALLSGVFHAFAYSVEILLFRRQALGRDPDQRIYDRIIIVDNFCTRFDHHRPQRLIFFTVFNQQAGLVVALIVDDFLRFRKCRDR